MKSLLECSSGGLFLIFVIDLNIKIPYFCSKSSAMAIQAIGGNSQ